MHNHHIDDLINYKLKQLKLMLDPADWNRLEQKFSKALEDHIAQKLSTYELSSDSSDWPALNALLNEAFDAQIKQVLTDHELNLEPADWGLLAASLDAQPFDQAIARQLHGIEVEVEQEDWKLFAASLDEHTLDTQIRERLEGLEFQVEHTDWESFESKIESSFDEQVKQKLSGLTLRASSEDWVAMMALLDGDIFISEIREALDGVEVQDFKREDWKAMEDKLNQPLYTAFQEKFAFHSIAPLKGDWKAMEALLQEEDPKPVIIPWYVRNRMYLTAASVLILFILSPFWIGKDSKLRDSVRKFTFNKEVQSSTKEAPGDISQPEIASAAPTKSTEPRLLELNASDEHVSDPSSLVSAGTDAVLNSIPVGLPNAPQQIEAQPAVAFQAPELNGTGVHLKAPEQITSKEEKSSPKVNLGEISREGLLRSIPFQSFANPWMMGPEAHSKGINKVSGFKRRRQPIRLGLYLGTSRTVVELSSPKAGESGDSRKNFGETFITGLRAEFNIKRNFYFVTGLNYEKRHFEHQYEIFPSQDQTPLTLYNPTEPIDQFISADIQMLELPLLVRILGESKNNLAGYIQVGVVPMISLRERYEHWEETDVQFLERVSSDNLSNTESQTQDWRFNTYAGNIHGAMGLDYRLNNELSIGLELNGFISLQRTKGSGSLNLQKKMYTGGIAVSLMRGLSRK